MEIVVHKGTVKLKTKRLILRKLEISDAKEMFNNWASDEDVTKYLTWKAHKNIEDTKEILNDWAKSYSKQDFYQWGIVLKETKELIGTIGVVDNKENRLISVIGYAIGKKFWGNGYVTEALNEVIDFLFTETNVNRIEAVHDVENTASGKVLLKCNLKFEGILRDRGLNNDAALIDLAIYSIIRQDFSSKRN